MRPELLQGDAAVDDRGQVGFVNDFSFDEVKRFYTVSNHRRGTVRAWHGHRQEQKFVLAVTGTVLVCCVEVDDWERPSPDLAVHRFVLSEDKPSVLHIPAGSANGFMPLTEGAKLMFFSSSTVAESREDDIRIPARFWDPWSVEER